MYSDSHATRGLARALGEELDAYVGRLEETLSRLEWQSDGHRQWYTHKNKYGCWICDSLFLARNLFDELVSEIKRTKDEDVNIPKSD